MLPSNNPPPSPDPHLPTTEVSDSYLGTQLVLLARALAAVAESVQEVYAAMDSVFLGPSERETTSLPLGPHGEQLTIAEMLGRVERFASEDGIRLIQEGSQDAVAALKKILDDLHTLLDAAARLSASSSPLPTQSFHSDRVHRSLIELSTRLKQASVLR